MGFNSKGKGKGAGKSAKVIPNKTVWVGNIPDGVSFRDLLTFANEHGNACWADVFPKNGRGTGAVGFRTSEDAEAAAQMMHGNYFFGAVLHCESWEKASSAASPASPVTRVIRGSTFQKQKGGKGLQKVHEKGKGKGKGEGKSKSIKVSHPGKTIWIGNIADGVTFRDVLELARQCGNAKWADVFPKNGKGTGAVGFSSEEEAAAAIGALNGVELGGQEIFCDSWSKQ